MLSVLLADFQMFGCHVTHTTNTVFMCCFAGQVYLGIYVLATGALTHVHCQLLSLQILQVQFYNDKPQLMSRIAKGWEHFYYQIYALNGDRDEPYAWGGWGVSTGAEPGPLVLTAEGQQLLQDMKAFRGDRSGGRCRVGATATASFSYHG
jgi:hypothetical protein